MNPLYHMKEKTCGWMCEVYSLVTGNIEAERYIDIVQLALRKVAQIFFCIGAVKLAPRIIVTIYNSNPYVWISAALGLALLHDIPIIISKLSEIIEKKIENKNGVGTHIVNLNEYAMPNNLLPLIPARQWEKLVTTIVDQYEFEYTKITCKFKEIKQMFFENKPN